MTRFTQVAIRRCCLPFLAMIVAVSPLRNDIKAEIAQLVSDGSPAAIERLNEIWRDNDPKSFDLVARGIVTVAQNKFLKGDKELANRLAKNIWLSSSANENRIDAWRLIHLCQSDPRILAEGHQVTLAADGGRDHERFANWIREQFIEPNDLVIDFEITYQLTMIERARAGELLTMTFVLSDAEHQGKFLEQVANSKSTFPTKEWEVIRHSPIADGR